MTLGKPPRLDWIFQRYDPPLYFVCTARRTPILANEEVHRAVTEYGERGVEKNVALGRYVIMPDHIHLFVRGGPEFNLGLWVRGLKRVVAAAVTGGRERLRGSELSPPAASDGGSYNSSDRGRNIWQKRILRSSLAEFRELRAEMGVCAGESGARRFGE